MDTRFWGPSGWKLFHLITFDYEYRSDSAFSFSSFFETIPYILPCKFCRASLTDYYRMHPFSLRNGGLDPQLDLKRWMYTIHDLVNAKLKKQGLHPQSSPPFSQVKTYYTDLQKQSWQEQLALFWDFLFAVGYHHPKESSTHSEPMPDCPKEAKTCKDPCERNKWNVLPWKKRMNWFKRFWIFLPAVLPHEIAKHWKEIEKKNPPTLTCRKSTLAWLWRMRCGLDASFIDPYTSICKKIAGYSSDCGKKSSGITCRKIRKHSMNRSKSSSRIRTVKKTKKDSRV